jgi:uncharacterized protein YjaG (DUF416 family)
MLTFDEKKLVADLERLTPSLRVAFAAASAQRQMTAYRLFASKRHVEDSDALDRALDDAWENPTKRGAELQRQLDECMALIPQEEVVQPWTEDANHAQDAGMSVAYVLRARIGGESQEAAWSARHAWESLYQFVIDTEGLDINKPRDMARVLSHPLVQAELARQRRDLDELLSVSDENLQQVIARLRDRSNGESETFFTAGV